MNTYRATTIASQVTAKAGKPAATTCLMASAGFTLGQIISWSVGMIDGETAFERSFFMVLACLTLALLLRGYRKAA